MWVRSSVCDRVVELCIELPSEHVLGGTGVEAVHRVRLRDIQLRDDDVVCSV